MSVAISRVVFYYDKVQLSPTIALYVVESVGDLSTIMNPKEGDLCAINESPIKLAIYTSGAWSVQSFSSPAVYQYATLSAFPITGIPTVLYLDKSQGEIYYWDNTEYVKLIGGLDATLPQTITGQYTFSTDAKGSDGTKYATQGWVNANNYLSGATGGTSTQLRMGDGSLNTFPTLLAATNAGGDLTGTYPNPTINTINGITKTYYDPTSSIQTQINSKLASSLAATTYLPLAGGTLSGDLQQPLAPVNGTSVVTKNYIDNLLLGVIWVGVEADSTSNITLSGEQTINGVTTSGSRVFVHAQTDGIENGVYISSTGAWTRASDAATGAQISKLAVLIVGGTNKGQQWVNTNASVILGTTSIVFSQNFGIIYGAGTGLLLSGTAFTIDSSYTSSASITGYLLNTDWSHFNTAYLNRISSLTTTGTSGAASFTGNVLNIPTYTLAGLGGEPSITAGTSAQYWRGDKTWQTLPTLPTVGTWGALNYPTWTSGSPFIKMTAAGTFGLDTSVYLTANQTITLTGAVTGSGTTSIATTLASSIVGLSNLTATGTPSSTTYLRGDNTWATINVSIGGSNTQIQFNNSGSFAGDSNLIWDNTYKKLMLGTTSSVSAPSFQVYQPTTGIGTVTITSGAVTGSGTQFTNTFKVGDTLVCNGTTYTITVLSSDTSLTVTPTTPNQTAGSTYTLTGGNVFNVKGNGNTAFSGGLSWTPSNGTLTMLGGTLTLYSNYSIYGQINLTANQGVVITNGGLAVKASSFSVYGSENSNGSGLNWNGYRISLSNSSSGSPQSYIGISGGNQNGAISSLGFYITGQESGASSIKGGTLYLAGGNGGNNPGDIILGVYLNGKIGGNVSIGSSTTTSLFQVYQPTAGAGTITISGTTITGINGTQFTNTFKIGDIITVTPTTTAWSSVTAYVIGNVVTNGGNMYNVTTAGTGGTGPVGTSTTPTQFGGAGAFFTYVASNYTITAIASDTSMTVGTTATLSAASSYTLTGGTKFQVFGNGNVTWGGSTSTIGGANSKMWWDATNNALNIGTATIQSTYLLNVNGSSQITIPSGVTATYALTINSPSGSNLSNGILIGGGYIGNGCIVFNTNGSGHPYGVYNTSGSNVSAMLGGTVSSMCNLTTTSYSLINYSGGILTPSGVNSGGITVNDSSTTPYAFSANRTGSGVFRTYNQVMNSVTFLASTPNNSTLISSYYYSAGNGSVWTQMYEANQFGAILIDNTYLSGAVTKTAFIWSTTSVGVLGERMRLVGDSLLINTTSPDSSSILSIVSNTKGVLLPRMTTTQKTSITSPATGLVLYDTTLNKLCVFTGTVWETVTSV